MRPPGLLGVEVERKMQHERAVTGVTVASLARLGGPALADFTRIYEAIFPAEERESTEKVVAAIHRGRMRCIAAVQDDGLCGFAVVLPLAEPARGVQYLGYLGVDPDLQSAGVGARLLRGCCEAGHGLGTVLEIEDPDATGAGNAQQRRRRAAFYERNGAAFVTGAPRYRAPNFFGPGGPLAYRLMWIPGSVPELSGDALRACVEAMLVQGYGLSADDELVRANLASLR